MLDDCLFTCTSPQDDAKNTGRTLPIEQRREFQLAVGSMLALLMAWLMLHAFF
jgi:hypothetical protein